MLVMPVLVDWYCAGSITMRVYAHRLPDPTSLFLQENRHLNVEGHRFVAGILADTIAALIR